MNTRLAYTIKQCEMSCHYLRCLIFAKVAYITFQLKIDDAIFR